MTDKNSNSGEQEEKPVEFYKDRDVFGLEKPIVNPEQEQKISRQTKKELTSETVIPDAPYSEYQSVENFCLLSILSFGLYQVYWFYKHWSFLRDEKKINILPVWRALLIIFFGYSLFRKFYKLAVEKGYKGNPSLGLLFIIYIALSLFAYLPGDYLWIITLLSFIPLIPILNMMNFYYVKEQQNYNIRKKLTKGEKKFLYIFWGLIILLVLFSS